MNKSLYLEQLSRTALLYILAVLLTTTAILYSFIPVWISITAVVCVCWRLFIFMGKLSFPPTAVKTLLVLLAIIGSFIQYRNTLSLDMFVAILMLGFSLRLLEIYRKQEAQILLYLAFFVLMTYLFYEQTLIAGVLAILQVLLIVSALIAVNSDARWLDNQFLQPIKKSSFVLMISLPLMVVIFLIMPRVPSLWVMPLQTQQAKTGMNEQMSPGDITSLTNSADLVFRATFVNQIPPKEELYWQALMFDEFDGRQWKNNCECNDTWVASNRVQWPQPMQEALWRYQIILEPHGHRWLFALPGTYIQDDKIRSNNDNLFRYRRDIVDRTIYDGVVFSFVKNKPLTTLERKRYTQLPALGNPLAHKLANQWRAQHPNDSNVVEQALFFYNQTLSYTLTPPALGENSVDDFLFVTKAGFCEHLAGSFVFLMRAAGIPARVILGYQGGEINAQGNYVVVRQYDAHAWAEVWLPDQGWVRVDPTNSVNPSRISAGFEAAFANSTVLNSPLNLKAYRNINLINLLRMKLDYIDYAWSRWVVGYNANTQQGLLSVLGMVSIWQMFIWLASGFFVFFLCFFIFLAWRDRGLQREHYLTTAYRKLSLAYTAFGVTRSLADTPKHFAQRVNDNHAPYYKEFALITQQYDDWVCRQQPISFSPRKLAYQCWYWRIRLNLRSFIL